MYTCANFASYPYNKLYDLTYNYANNSYISNLHEIHSEQLAINFTTTADKRVHWAYQNYLLCTEGETDFNGGLEYMQAYCGNVDWNSTDAVISMLELDFSQVLMSTISS